MTSSFQTSIAWSQREDCPLTLYHKDVFFAVLDDDQLYFKVDDDSRPDYLSAGMHSFQPTRDGPASKTYYEVPELNDHLPKAMGAADRRAFRLLMRARSHWPLVRT